MQLRKEKFQLSRQDKIKKKKVQATEIKLTFIATVNGIETFLFASTYSLQLSRSPGKRSISYRRGTFSDSREFFRFDFNLFAILAIMNQLR